MFELIKGVILLSALLSLVASESSIARHSPPNSIRDYAFLRSLEDKLLIPTANDSDNDIHTSNDVHLKLGNILGEKAEFANISQVSYKPSKQYELYSKLSETSLLNENLRITGKFWLKPTASYKEGKSLFDVMVKYFVAKFTSNFYNDMLMHVYDDFNEMKLSTSQASNPEVCLSQLAQVTERAADVEREHYETKDLNLHQLLDTYGRPPAGLMSGSLFWPGVYDECLKLKIEARNNQQHSTRYCIASLSPTAVPSSFNKSHTELVAFKAGVCIPKACDSLNYKNKFQLILKLVKFNFRSFEKNKLHISDLYCVPEEGSPLRSWWKSPKSLIAVVALASWVGVVIYATFRYEISRKNGDKMIHADEERVDLSLKDGLKLGDSQEGHATSGNITRVFKSLSIINNAHSLFGAKRDELRVSQNDGSKVMQRELSESEEKQVVDLRYLDGIKVICMSYVITGHVLMCMFLLISNGRHITEKSLPTYYLANMIPAFAVNAFFAITGLLTTYLLFKQNQTHSFLTSPVKWVGFILYRYMRIMPMYAAVFFYCKYVSKFTGSGPHWDYGTSSWAPRRKCEQESWLWTLLFGANFKPPLEHCIPSAWYLANDFQFFMVTPIFLVALYKNPEFGKRLLKLCIGAGYLAGISSVLLTDADLRPVFAFHPHGFKTYVTFLSHNYTRPQYRIPAYLCGLLIGYVLHTYEQNKLKYLKAKETKEAQGEDATDLVEPCWPEYFRDYGATASLLAVSICCTLPIVASVLPLTQITAKFMVALVMSSYHIVFALAVSSYIILSTTGFGNKTLDDLLSASFWKPLAKLSLCAVLINVEVINYLVQTSREQLHLDFYSHTSFNLLCIVATYVVATVVYLFFEAPMKNALGYPLRLAMAKLANKKKAH